MPSALISRYFADLPPIDSPASAEILIAEAHHRIANDLTLVAGLLRLQTSSVAKEGRTLSADEVCTILQEAGSRIEAISGLHRMLATSDPGAAIDLGPYLREVAVRTLWSISRDGAVALEQTTSGPRHIAPPELVLPMALFVGEVVTNAVKYAHPTGVRGRVWLGCHPKADGSVVIEVADDGVGLPDGFDPARDGGLGLRLVRTLTEQLGARLMFQSTNLGLTVRLLMPPDAKPESFERSPWQ